MKDAFEAFWVILRFALSRDIYIDKDKDILDAFSDAPNFNRWMADTIQPYIGKGMMEIGAGIGNLSQLLIARRKRYIATDLEGRTLGAAPFRAPHGQAQPGDRSNSMRRVPKTI